MDSCGASRQMTNFIGAYCHYEVEVSFSDHFQEYRDNVTKKTITNGTCNNHVKLSAE
jgi:hypothetical protein